MSSLTVLAMSDLGPLIVLAIFGMFALAIFFGRKAKIKHELTPNRETSEMSVDSELD